MRRGDYFLLLVVGLIVILGTAALEPVPGYMDADYYYAGGMQLAGGHGFTDPFLWNYLDHPQGLPQPSNSYWYPLASMVAASGMFLSGRINFLAARSGFVLMAVLAPLAVAALADRITRRRHLALTAGFLAIFSGYYLPFIATTDNYSLYLIVGALFFLFLEKISPPKAILLGLLAGLLNLARGDGLLWLPITLLAVMVLAYRQVPERSRWARLGFSCGYGCLALLGYLLVMGAWFVRNLSVFGTIMPPGSGSVLWMTSYNQIFSFTPEIYTFRTWLASGLQAALQARGSALWQNLGTAFFAEGMVFFSPLILWGIWKLRNQFRVQVGLLGWLLMLLAESLLFPFASVNGGFFHAGAVFQPVWYALAPLGLEALGERLVKWNRHFTRVTRLFPAAMILVMVLLSGMLIKIRVIDSGWNEGEYLYQQADQFLSTKGAGREAIVMVRNPPAYFIMTGRRAIVVPFGDVQSLLAASRKYGASYVILENIGDANPLFDLYLHPEKYPEFNQLGALGENHVLSINPSP